MSVSVCSYGGFFLIVLSEALMRDPITDHGAGVTTMWILWAVLSAVSFLKAQRDDGMDTIAGRPNQAAA